MVRGFFMIQKNSKMKIIGAPLAIERASEIAEYIAQDKPSAAEKWIDTIFAFFSQDAELLAPVKNQFVPACLTGQILIIYPERFQ